MANQEHEDILWQGVEVWNTWRAEHPEILPDLEGASFYGLDLFEANLTQANLRRANLAEADLRGACFNSANLSEANLIMADLEGVDMRKAGFALLRQRVLHAV